MGLNASVYRDDEEERQITSVRLGNIALIGYLSDVISRKVPGATVLLNRVLYSGAHAGDQLTTDELRRASRELDEVNHAISGDVDVQTFVRTFREIIDIALKHDRPITF